MLHHHSHIQESLHVSGSVLPSPVPIPFRRKCAANMNEV